MQLYNHNPSAQIINCTCVSKHQLLKLLLMFVTYCLDVLKQSQPQFQASFLPYTTTCVTAWPTVPYSTTHSSVPLRLVWHASLVQINDREMVQWIIRRRTPPGHNPSDMMLATGVAMAYNLCLRASEYASRTIVPRDDSHQFVSESVEFTCSGSDVFVPSHLMHRHRWSEVGNMRRTSKSATASLFGSLPTKTMPTQ